MTAPPRRRREVAREASGGGMTPAETARIREAVRAVVAQAAGPATPEQLAAVSLLSPFVRRAAEGRMAAPLRA